MKFTSSFVAIALTVGHLVAAAPVVDVAGDNIVIDFCDVDHNCSEFSVSPAVCTNMDLVDITNVEMTQPRAYCQLYTDVGCEGRNTFVSGTISIPPEFSHISSFVCQPPPQ